MEFHYRYHDTEYAITLEAQPDGALIARIGDRSYRAEIERQAGGEIVFRMDGRPVHGFVAVGPAAPDGAHHYVALTGRDTRVLELVKVTESTRRHGGRGGAAGALKAQMPGQVMQVFVAEGDVVTEGQALMLLEAMKMEIRVSAPVAGAVTRLLVAAGQTVERGQELAQIEPEG